MDLCRSPIGSRVIDTLLDSETVPSKAKRKLMLSLIGRYHELADDRIGSRVCDRCWATADPYLKEKIARSLMPQERFLLGSQTGRFFGRKLQLQSLKNNPEGWKASQAQASKAVASGTQVVNSIPPSSQQAPAKASEDGGAINGDTKKKRKRHTKEIDEIDAVFSKLGKKIKKGRLDANFGSSQSSKSEGDLKGVMDAIRSAPKDAKR